MSEKTILIELLIDGLELFHRFVIINDEVNEIKEATLRETEKVFVVP